ncbi:hypothetical protein ES703_14511 [subsurface metagenome]
MDTVLAGLAFGAGVAAFFNPCSYAMLPAYVSYYLGRGDKNEKAKSTLRRGLEGAGFGTAATLGFLSVFLIVGTLVSWIGAGIRPYFPWLSVAVGIVLMALGLLWLMNISLPSPPSLKAPQKTAHLSFYFFGIAYAFAAVACVLPLFLMIVLSALTTGGFASGLLIFIIYALGMGTMMITVAVAVALSKGLLLRYFRSALPHIKKASAIILIAAGAYMIYLWYTTFV